jgi:hypothetical protein
MFVHTAVGDDEGDLDAAEPLFLSKSSVCTVDSSLKKGNFVERTRRTVVPLSCL